LSGIGLDSNQHAAREYLDRLQDNTVRTIIVELESSQPGGAGDHTQQRLAERRAPGPHGLDVPFARPRRTVGMRVPESEHVTPTLLPVENAWAIELNAGRSAHAMMDTARVPDPAAPLADERPVLLDRRRQGAGGCTSQ